MAATPAMNERPPQTPDDTPADTPTGPRERPGARRRAAPRGGRPALGGVAHDFNNLLSVILSYSSELEWSLEDPEQKERATEIRAAAERGARLTRQLLSLTRRRRRSRSRPTSTGPCARRRSS